MKSFQHRLLHVAAGRRIGCDKSGSAFTTPDTYAYRYNTRSELTNATAAVDSAYRYGYDFDDIGNRMTSSERGVESAEYTANNLNQYTNIICSSVQPSTSNLQPVYDEDGNQTLVKTTTGIWQITYNGENRPVRWENGDSVITMSFDRMGRRVTKNDQRFVYNGYLQIANFRSTTTTSDYNYFIWDPTEPVATRPLAWTTPTTNHQSPTTSFYTHDGNKNVSEVIDTNTDVAAHYEYAPFGALTAQRGVSAAANPWRFSSEYAEDETATVYYNYRHYEPVTGRWTARDPIAEWGGLNMLAFVCNCSVSTVDIAGMSIGDYIPIWSTLMSAIDLVIGHIPGQSSVDYPFVSPSECKCNEEAAEASCIKAVEIKAIEYTSEALKQLVTGVIVDAIVSVVGIKANFLVGGILAVNTLVDMGLKSKIYSKVMSGSNEAMKHNCDCGQYMK